jgi:hypothetical protein
LVVSAFVIFKWLYWQHFCFTTNFSQNFISPHPLPDTGWKFGRRTTGPRSRASHWTNLQRPRASFRFVAENSVEAKMLALQQEAKAIQGKGGFENLNSEENRKARTLSPLHVRRADIPTTARASHH